jgi:hypothetical protein
VDLAGEIGGWQAWLHDRVVPEIATHYLAHLRTLIPEGRLFWRSALIGPAVARSLATRTGLVQKRPKRAKGSCRQPDHAPRPVSASTKRRYLAAVRSFAALPARGGSAEREPGSRRLRSAGRGSPLPLLGASRRTAARGRRSPAFPRRLRARLWRRA